MNNITPDYLARSRDAFTSDAAMSLQDIRDRVAAHEAGTQRRDSLSALDSVSRAFDRPLSSIPANPKSVRTLLESKSAAQLGLSGKRYANVRSSLAKAVREHGEAPQPITKCIPLTPAWTALLERIEKRSYRMALYRLAAFSSFMGIEPTSVGPETLLGFHEAMEAEEIVKNPRRVLKHTIAHWNMCRKLVSRWPEITLASPFKSPPAILPITAFPTSFQDDVRRWKTRLSDPDLLDPDAPPKALRAATISFQEQIVRRFASALVHRGDLALSDVISLAGLLTPPLFKSGLRFFLDRLGGRTTQYLGNIAGILTNIARHYCKLDESVLKEIAQISGRLKSREPRQLTARNRERLRQFDDPKNVARLLAFPQEERARGIAQHNPYRAAKCFERALAVALLIHCTLRIQNLRSINLVTDIRWAGGKCYLSIAAEKVKNNQALDFELPADVAELLKEYVATYRPRLPGAAGPYLFPGSDGGPRPHSTMRQNFIDVMRKHAGLIMNPHLMRHAIAKIVVERDPALYAVMSRQLGHKRMDMTMSHYLGTETRAAGRHINKLLSAALVDPVIPEE